LNDKTVELLSTIISHVVHERISQLIKAMIDHQMCDGPKLSQKMITMVNDEAKKEMEQLIAQMLQAAFMSD
jgi:hypothetical protein